MNWIDLIIVGIIGISIFFGLKKGFLFSLFSLLSLVAGFYLAGYFTSLLSPMLNKSRLIEALVFTGLFILFVVLFYGVGKLLLFLSRIFISGAADRLLGVLMGLLRGMLICGIILFFMLLLDAFNFEPVRKSKIAPKIMHSMKIVLNKAPAKIKAQLVKFSPDK